MHIKPLIGNVVKNPSSCQLRNLLIKFLFDSGFLDEYDYCHSCLAAERREMLKNIVKILSNILLNNFCKVLTSQNKELISEKGCGSVKRKDQKLINMVGK